jgi:hypothetical protein
MLDGKPKRKNHLEDLGVDVKIILKCILKEQDVWVWTGFSWFKIRSVTGSCEHFNEPLTSIKGRVFLLDQMNNYHLLKNVSALLELTI